MDATSLGNLLLDPTASVIIPSYILDAIRLSLSNSITYVFFIGAFIVLIALVVSVFVRSVPLKSAAEYHQRDTAIAPAPAKADAADALGAGRSTEVPEK